MTPISKNLFIIIALFISFSGSSQEFDLNAATAYALKHNYNYQKQELDRAITYEKTNEVLSMGFPKLNGTIGYRNSFQLPTSILPGEIIGKPGTTVPVQFGTSNNADIGLSLQQLIFDGRYLVGVQARKSIKALADAQLKVSEVGVKELIYKSFYQALVSDQSIKVLEENQKVLDKLLDDTRKTYKQGLIEELDVERLEYNVLNLKNTISNVINQREVAYLALKYNMGFPLDSSFKIKGNLDQDLVIIKNEVKSTQFDINNKPELKLIEENINLKVFDLKQTKAGYLPSLYGNAAYGWQAQRQKFDFLSGGQWFAYGNFGIQLQVPIFDGFTKKYQVGQTKLALEKARFEMTEFRNGSYIQHQQAQINLQNAINEYENNDNILKLSTKIQTKTQIKYKEGVGSSYEFAQAQSERIQQQLRVIQSILNVAIKGIEYRKVNGKL